MRYIIEVTTSRSRAQTLIAVFLGKPEEAVGHVTGGGEHITHIMKQHSAQVTSDQGERQRRSAQLQIVDEKRFTAQREAAGQVAWSGLVDAETTVGCRTAHEEPLRERSEA